MKIGDARTRRGGLSGIRCAESRAVLAERESQQARAQQHQACHGQYEESVGYKIVVAHDTPATADARPNLLKLS